MALSPNNRIKKEKEIRRIYTEGAVIRSGAFFLKRRESGLPIVRIGFSIPAKKIPEATTRNRIRRVFSEYIKENLQNMQGGYDIMIGLTGKPDMKNLQTAAGELFRAAGLIKRQ